MLKAALTISFPSRASKVTLSTEPAEKQNQQNLQDQVQSGLVRTPESSLEEPGWRSRQQHPASRI